MLYWFAYQFHLTCSLKCTQSLADKVVDQLLPVHKEDLEQDAGQMAIGQVGEGLKLFN